MTARYLAFLRGVNLGRRQVRSADLAAALTDLGLAAVKTLLASGNAAFNSATPPERAPIEAALAARFGFDIGVVLRSQDELVAMIAADPFAGRIQTDDSKLYVTLLADKVHDPAVPASVPDDFEIVRTLPREVFYIVYRQPDGRYGPGLDKASKPLDRAVLATTRNWNTILKAATL